MELIDYLLKVSACSALFFAFYILVLRKLTFFRLNRFFLLFSLLLSFLIPASQIKIERVQEQLTTGNSVIRTDNKEMTGILKTSLSTVENTGSVDLIPFLFILYIIIAVALLGFAALKLIKLFRYARSNASEINGLIVVPKTNGFTNCSFFNYVFINENSLTEQELQVLLRHEQVHANELHSIDKLILTVLKSILWFNPVIYLYDKMIEETHEFEADQKTSENFGAQPYAHLLLKLAVEKSNMPLVHNFVKSPLKQRIKMLFNSKSNNMKKFIYILAFPIALCLVWGFAVKIVYASPVFEPVKYAKPIDSPITSSIVIAPKLIANKTAKIKSETKAQEVSNMQTTTIAVPLKKEEQSIYSRYPGTNSNGEPCDIVEIKTAGGGSASVEVKKNGKALIIINGMRYSEEEVKMMGKDKIANIKSISAVDGSLEKYYPELVGKYDGVIELPSGLPLN